MWGIAGENKNHTQLQNPQCLPSTNPHHTKPQNFSIHVVSVELGLKQFIIPLRCNSTSNPQSGIHLLSSQDMCVTNTCPLLGLKFHLFTCCWRRECFLCACATPVIHMLVRKHPNLHMWRLVGRGCQWFLALPISGIDWQDSNWTSSSIQVFSVPTITNTYFYVRVFFFEMAL